eukprot:6724127-Alexandrium_andersonii.AAC.1
MRQDLDHAQKCPEVRTPGRIRASSHHCTILSLPALLCLLPQPKVQTVRVPRQPKRDLAVQKLIDDVRDGAPTPPHNGRCVQLEQGLVARVGGSKKALVDEQLFGPTVLQEG